MSRLGQTVGPCAHCHGLCFLSGSARLAARAIDAFRRGWAVTVSGGDGALTLVPVETGPEGAAAGSQLLISAARAETLKLRGQRAAAEPEKPVLIALSEAMGTAELLAIADPMLDMRHPMKGPFRTDPLTATQAANAAMELARMAHILPAFVVVEDQAEDHVSTTDVEAFCDSDALHISAQAKLPVATCEEARIYGFRSEADAADHIALVVGKRDDSVPLVRLHSECLTGDMLGSLKCDCGPQLHDALAQIAEASWGVLLYLRQEGRGIGLINKLRAYALQDEGFDTVDANRRLGFAVDARDFAIAARMLDLLGVRQVKLLTNNPEKVAGLSAAGVDVTERLPTKIAANPHNEHYLDTKRDRTGHQL